MMTLPEVLSRLNRPEDFSRFLHDLCTPGELKEMEMRWQVAQMLDGGADSYRDIAEKAGTSTTTVTRVARFLNDEPYQGYRMALAASYPRSAASRHAKGRAT